VTTSLLSLLLQQSEGAGAAILRWPSVPEDSRPLLKRLLGSRLLIERAISETWCRCSDCTCPEGARLIVRDGTGVCAVCPLDSSEDVELSEDHLRSFSVDRGRLAALIALDRNVLHEPMPGLWSLGFSQAENRWLFLVLQRAVGQQSSILPVLRSSARGGEITLVAPRLSASATNRLLEARVRWLDVQEAIALHQDGQVTLNVSTTDEPAAFVPPLRVCFRTGCVIVEGKPQQVGGAPCKLLRMLVAAWQSETGVTSDAIEEAFSRREAKDVVRDLRRDLSSGRANHAAIHRWIATERHPTAYRLALPRGSVQVIP